MIVKSAVSAVLAVAVWAGFLGGTEQGSAVPIPRLAVGYSDASRGVVYQFTLRPAPAGACTISIALIYGRDGREIRSVAFRYNWCNRGSRLARLLYAPPPSAGPGYRACVAASQALPNGSLSTHRRCRNFTVK